MAKAAKLSVANAPSVVTLRPAVNAAGFRRRHYWLLGSFAMLVLAPLLLAAWYLYNRAADQYISTLGFVVRSENSPSGQDILGGLSGLAALSSTSSSDTDILYEYLLSQALVAKVDQRMDLHSLWSKPTNDPIFAFDPAGTIEDLTDYWWRMLRVSYDTNAGLIGLQVHGFAPDDAQQIAIVVLEESSAMINEMSSLARKDATRYAQLEFERAAERLQIAREALKSFRAKSHIVDPLADLQGEMGVLGQLQQKLADELIALDMLRSTAANLTSNTATDPRVLQAELRVKVIRDRITGERQNFAGDGGGRDYSALVGEFERLNVDLEFAQQSYVAGLAALDLARANAQRQNRYLASYIAPTLAQKPLYPKRAQILGIMALVLCLGWAFLVLLGYNLRDRR